MITNLGARLEALKARLSDVDEELASPTLLHDGARFKQIGRERARLQRIVSQIE